MNEDGVWCVVAAMTRYHYHYGQYIRHLFYWKLLRGLRSSGEVEAGQTINKLAAHYYRFNLLCIRRCQAERKHFSEFWSGSEQMSQALIVCWTACHGDVTSGESLCSISKDWDSLAWENVPQSLNSEIWEALKSKWLPLKCDSFK